MKTIGEQAQAFRLAKGWTTKQMAAACKTSRQNIETLEAKGDRTPRYIKELARVMGTKVDVLMEGRYVVGNVTVEPGAVLHAAAEIPPATGGELVDALNVLARTFSAADEITRSAVAPLLSLLALKPQQIESITSTLIKLLPDASLNMARESQGAPSTGTIFGGLGRPEDLAGNEQGNRIHSRSSKH